MRYLTGFAALFAVWSTLGYARPLPIDDRAVDRLATACGIVVETPADDNPPTSQKDGYLFRRGEAGGTFLDTTSVGTQVHWLSLATGDRTIFETCGKSIIRSVFSDWPGATVWADKVTGNRSADNCSTKSKATRKTTWKGRELTVCAGQDGGISLSIRSDDVASGKVLIWW